MADNYKLSVVHMQIKAKKKLLYVMGIDWDWIFQRPQILEQHLEEKYDVTVIFPRSVLHFFKRPKGTYPAKYKILWTLPWQEKNRFIYFWSCLLSKRLFRDIDHYDAVFIGYPLYYRYIPESYQGGIIYDCMDNHEALYKDSKNVKKLINQEIALAQNCSIMIVSGSALQNKMKKLCAAQGKEPVLLRNASDVDRMLYYPYAMCAPMYKIGYFGTISEWFDYDILLKSSKELSNIEYHIIGPVLKLCETGCKQIIMEGIVEHQKLYAVTADYACLIMPFIISEVVKWVDPVKLYEYIAMGKCIISVRYEEIERFEDYVYFYSGYEEYLSILKELISKGFPPKYTQEQQQMFLKSNSWQERFRKLDEVVETTLQPD